MRLLRVGDIALDEPLYLVDRFEAVENEQRTDKAIDGNEIIFIAQKQYKNLKFSSEEITWIKKSTLEALIDLANNSLGSQVDIQTDLGAKKVRFDYESSAVSGEPLFKGSELFLVEINFKEIR